MKSDKGPKRATVALEPEMTISLTGVSFSDRAFVSCDQTIEEKDVRAGPSSRLMANNLEDFVRLCRGSFDRMELLLTEWY